MARIYGPLASGERVLVTKRSHLHENATRYFSTALSFVCSEGAEMVECEVEFPRPIGLNDYVVAAPGDRIEIGCRPNRREAVPFAIGRAAEPCDSLTVVLRRYPGEHAYFLVTGYIGHLFKDRSRRVFARVAAPSGTADDAPSEPAAVLVRSQAYQEAVASLAREYPEARASRPDRPPYRPGRWVRKVVRAQPARSVISRLSGCVRYAYRHYGSPDSGAWLATLSIHDSVAGRGYGPSKRQAAEAAAEAALSLLGLPYPRVLEVRRTDGRKGPHP